MFGRGAFGLVLLHQLPFDSADKQRLPERSRSLDVLRDYGLLLVEGLLVSFDRLDDAYLFLQRSQNDVRIEELASREMSQTAAALSGTDVLVQVLIYGVTE